MNNGPYIVILNFFGHRNVDFDQDEMDIIKGAIEYARYLMDDE